jgi:hypothetical protein
MNESPWDDPERRGALQLARLHPPREDQLPCLRAARAHLAWHMNGEPLDAGARRYVFVCAPV